MLIDLKAMLNAQSLRRDGRGFNPLQKHFFCNYFERNYVAIARVFAFTLFFVECTEEKSCTIIINY